MSISKKNSTNTFPLQVSLPLSPIRKEEEKSLHRIKIAVTRSIHISDSRQKSSIDVIHVFGAQPTI
jgi:hypothetical protein